MTARDIAPAGVHIAEIASFHLGGHAVRLSGRPKRVMQVSGDGIRREVDMNGTHVTGQLYTQQIRLMQPRHSAPALFWHGGGMTGAAWETTPDGRPGWQWLFLRAGFDVLVTDAVERGRASWSPWPEIYRTAPIFRSKEESWTLFRIGADQNYADAPEHRVPFEGQRFPVSGFDALCAQLVPRWTDHDELSLCAYEQLLRKVGPVNLIVHSQGGWFALNLAHRIPELIRAVVLLEPAGAPSLSAEQLHRAASVPHLVIWGDYFDRTPQWRTYREPVTGYARQLAQAGGRIDILDLPDHGIRGNSHLPMMDDNSEELAARVIDWLVAQD